MHTPRRLRLTVTAAAALFACHAGAIELDTGNPDWTLRFDNTLKASAIYRATQGSRFVREDGWWFYLDAVAG